MEFSSLKFSSEEDLVEVLNAGPWSYISHPLILLIGSPDLVIDVSQIQKLPIWVKFPNLRLHLWMERFLSKLASMIGKPIWSDGLTAKKQHIEYARVCIEVHANQSHHS